MKKSLLALSFLLSGCATVASKEATVACQVADGASTIYALRHGAVEANPVMSKVIAGLGPVGLVAVKLVAAYVLINFVSEELRAPANLVTCAVAVHNIGVVR